MLEVDEGLHAIIKLAAKEAAEKAIEEARKDWREDIADHSVLCTAKKFMKLETFVVGSIGGAIAAFTGWLINKL